MARDCAAGKTSAACRRPSRRRTLSERSSFRRAPSPTTMASTLLWWRHEDLPCGMRSPGCWECPLAWSCFGISWVTQRAEGKSTPLAPALAGTMVNRHDRRL